MTLFAVFDKLIAQHHAQILDSPEWCKTEFRKHGFTEDDLEVRLFFALLDKNISLETRKMTRSNKDFTVHGLSVLLYAKLFDTKAMTNEYESILLKQTELIVNVLAREEIIRLDFEEKPHNPKYEDIVPALEAIIQHYGSEVLSTPRRVKTILKDIAEPSLNDDIEQFLIFLVKLYQGNLSFSSESDAHYLKTLDEVLKRQNMTYQPIERELERYDVWKQEEERKEEERLTEEKRAESQKLVEEEKRLAERRKEIDRGYREFQEKQKKDYAEMFNEKQKRLTEVEKFLRRKKRNTIIINIIINIIKLLWPVLLLGFITLFFFAIDNYL